ncbi:MAG: ABC transporter ATP-binding protein [Actinobacteria bacterium]|nr:ABC transporter ATP-binding protein [Actinomycetota bacterium]
MEFEHEATTSPSAATRGPHGESDEREPAPPLGEPVIELSAVRKTYGSGDNAVEALKGIDFAAYPNRLTAIVGPSGSGKSTLLNLIGGLDTPDSGTIKFGGRDITRLSESELTKFRARNIGFVFQFLNLLPGLTCEQNVMLGGVIVGKPPHEAKRRAGELLEIVGLGDKQRRPARKLSGGQMQRVAIARALINDAPLLLADEPTGNLDERNAEEIIALLRERATDGRAVVLVTHNNDLAERYADDVKVVRSGSIHDQPVADLREIAPASQAPQATSAAADAPAAAPPSPNSQPLRLDIDTAASPDQLIATIAMSLARQGGDVRLRRGPGGRVEIEVDRT